MQLNELIDSISAFESSATGLGSSRKFTAVLQTILALGNHLNGSTPRGQAYGFKINTITKVFDFSYLLIMSQLGNTKTTDNKLTLLHYLVMVLKDQNKDALTFTNDFVSCEKASKSI